jgi:hypothetical protein
MPDSRAEADPVGLAYKQVAIPITKPGNLLDEVTDYRLQFSFDGEQQPTQEPALSHLCMVRACGKQQERSDWAHCLCY